VCSSDLHHLTKPAALEAVDELLARVTEPRVSSDPVHPA